MSIDIRTEAVVSLGQVPGLACIPRRRGSGRLHPSTVWRWALRGLNGIKLETIRVGGTVCTSVEALQRFFERLAGAEVPARAAPVPKCDPGETERQLDALGVTARAGRPGRIQRPGEHGCGGVNGSGSEV